jgi:hypothetical protein
MADDLVSLRVEGYNEFVAGLKKVDRDFARNLAKLHRVTANYVRDRARAAAGGRHSSAITGRGDDRSAKLVVKPGRRGDSLVKFFGAKRRTGWYAARKFSSSSGRQHKPWVGNQWDPGERNAVPYLIGDAINAAVPEIEREFVEWVELIARPAFPD